VAPEAELLALEVLAQLEVLVLLEVEAERVVEAVSVEAVHRSFSSAMVGS
jgi:hypothetical protein